jgi:hypothetical protein
MITKTHADTRDLDNIDMLVIVARDAFEAEVARLRDAHAGKTITAIEINICASIDKKDRRVQMDTVLDIIDQVSKE